jgi:hypothetical protein
LIRHGLQCCKTSCLSASTSFNAPGHWNFFLHAAAVSYAPDQKRRKGRQVDGALVPTAAVFYAPDKQKDKMHKKTSGPWFSGVNKFFNAERKKEKSFKISWIRVATKTTTAFHEEDHVLDPRIL